MEPTQHNAPLPPFHTLSAELQPRPAEAPLVRASRSTVRLPRCRLFKDQGASSSLRQRLHTPCPHCPLIMVGYPPRRLLVVLAAMVATLLVSALHATPGETAPATRVAAVGAKAPTASREGPGCYTNYFENCTSNKQCCNGWCQMWRSRRRRRTWSMCVPFSVRR